MATYTLIDFFPVYPEAGTPNMNKELLRKKEFGILTDSKKIVGINKPYQEFGVRLLAPWTGYRRFFPIWEPGAGKTYIALGVIEQYREIGYAKPIYAVDSAQKMTDVQQQIAKFRERLGYTKRKTKITKYESVGESISMKKQVGRYYNVTTHLKLAEYISTLTNEEITSKFNYVVVAIDEAHHLNPSASIHRGINIYNEISRLCKYSNAVIIPISGTPGTNDVYRYAETLNLVLPKNVNLDISRFKEIDNNPHNTVYNKAIAHEEAEKLNGYISILSNEGKPTPVDPPQASNIRISLNRISRDRFYELPMSIEHANSYYNNFISTKGTSDKLLSVLIMDPLVDLKSGIKIPYIAEREEEEDVISSMPRSSTRAITSQKVQISEEAAQLFDVDDEEDMLGLIAPSIKETILIAKNNPDKCIFMFIPFIRLSGTGILSSILRINGFKELTGMGGRNVHNENADRRMRAEAAKVRNDDLRSRGIEPTKEQLEEEKFTKVLSFGVIHSKLSPSEKDNIKFNFNRIDNRNADIMQILIGTESLMESHNFVNGRIFISPVFFWNMAQYLQTVSRLLRVNALDWLSGDERVVTTYKLVPRRLTPEFRKLMDMLQNKVSDDEFRDYFGNLPDKSVFNPVIQEVVDSLLKDKTYASVDDMRRDYHSYFNEIIKQILYSENKDVAITTFTDELEKINVNKYKQQEPVDYRSYNIYYAQDEMLQIEYRLRELFFSNDRYKMSELINILGENKHHPTTVIKTISNMVYGDSLVTNNLGFLCYLRSDEDWIFLQHTNTYGTQQSNIANYEYMSGFYNVEEQPLINIINIDVKGVFGKMKDSEVIEAVIKRSLPEKLSIFEWCIINPTERISVVLLALYNNTYREYKGQAQYMHFLMYTAIKEFSSYKSLETSVNKGLTRVFNKSTNRWDFISFKENEYIMQFESYLRQVRLAIVKQSNNTTYYEYYVMNNTLKMRDFSNPSNKGTTIRGYKKGENGLITLAEDYNVRLLGNNLTLDTFRVALKLYQMGRLLFL